MISTADELLAALDPLSHSARLRYTAVTARRLAARGELRPLPTTLDALGPYERRLAALAAMTAGEVEHVAARLADRDPVVRRYALHGARRLPVPDAAVEAAYDDAPAVVRADLARLLRDGRRSALAERMLLRARTEYGDRDAARLLPGCSTEFTARLLPELAAAIAFEDWSTLAVRHPFAVLDHAERELGDRPSERLRDPWWRRHATGIAAALPAARAACWTCWSGTAPTTCPVRCTTGWATSSPWTPSASRPGSPPPAVRPRGGKRTPGRAVLRRLAAADPPSPPGLGARWFHRDAFRVLLRSVPPGRRPGFVDAVVAAGDARRSVRARPGARPATGRRAARQDPCRGRGAPRRTPHGLGTLEPARPLPPAEDRPELLAALGTGDADERGTIWDRLVEKAGHSRDPGQVAEVLALAAGRLVNERDPVRGEALSAFADLPAPPTAAALEARTITPAAGAARIRSPGTAVSARAAGAGLLSHDPGHDPDPGRVPAHRRRGGEPDADAGKPARKARRCRSRRCRRRVTQCSA
ncbi:hypothetical protein [Streptomyces sp. HUAS TT3]|uniref:hypothetical protein n=1 Tax=Streptomyces sp. HUAS TT3 TaxID=3447510 RepID=UPI003F65DF03